MKLRTLIVTVAALFVFTGSLYAAGDLIVNGNLGVGTPTPAAKAEINGSMKVDSDMAVQGNLVTNGTTSLGGNTTVNGSTVVNGNLLVSTGTTTLGGSTTTMTGNAVVNGQLSVGTQGVKFSDGTVLTTTKTLVWDYTVTAATTTVTISNLDGNAHGGYELEFIIENTTGSASDYRLYYENDMTNAHYYNARTGNIANGTPTTGNDAFFITGDSLPAGWTYYGNGYINISPAGYIHGTLFGMGSKPSTATPRSYYISHSYNTNKTNLTRLDIIAATAYGIGVNSRFRLWKRIQ